MEFKEKIINALIMSWREDVQKATTNEQKSIAISYVVAYQACRVLHGLEPLEFPTPKED